MKKLNISIVMLLVFVLSFTSTQNMNENLIVSKKILNITDKITIRLPIIKDSNNKELKELNKLIENTILEYFDYLISDNDGRLNLSIYFNSDDVKKYIGEVYISKNILSIPLYASIYQDGAASPVERLYAITIDIQSQKIIELKDLIDIKNLSEFLLSDKVDHPENLKAFYDIYQSAEKMIAEWVENEKEHNKRFFVTKDSIILIFSMPRVLGNYAVIEIRDYPQKE